MYNLTGTLNNKEYVIIVANVILLWFQVARLNIGLC